MFLGSWNVLGFLHRVPLHMQKPLGIPSLPNASSPASILNTIFRASWAWRRPTVARKFNYVVNIKDAKFAKAIFELPDHVSMGFESMTKHDKH